MMKKLIATAVSVLFAAAVYAQAPAPAPAEPKAEKPMKPQHAKMKACNAEAKDKALKGQERKDFMKTCLSKSKK
jgi:uncharacterized protein with FMN-binding domain